MKSFFFLCCIILNSICFGQSDSLKEPLIDLVITVKDYYTKAHTIGAKIKISGSDGSEKNVATDSTGTVSFMHANQSNFITVGNNYTIEIEGVLKEYLGTADAFTTIGITSNTRIHRDLQIMSGCNAYRARPFPTLLFDGYSSKIDSSKQDSLDIIYAMMIENPTMIIQVIGLFEHEKDFSPFQRRADAVRKRLIEMGIPKERLQIMVSKYSEVNDPAVTRDKANVIFKIISFDYVPTPP